MPRTQITPPIIGTATSLPNPLLTNIETRMGQRFDDVKVYESHSATLLGAAAFTQGRNLFFAPGEYQPNSRDGEELIAHELTHVVQQGVPLKVELANNLVESQEPEPGE